MSDVYGALPAAPEGELPAPPTAATTPTLAASAPDFAKIDRNMARLVQQNAPDEDIKTYLQSEGVTPDQVLTLKQGLIGRGMSSIASATQSAAGYISEAYRGKQDPARADVPGFTGEGISDLEVRSAINRAKVVTMDDAAYGDVIKKALGPRLVGAEKDVHGQEIVTYRDDAGQERKAYVNKPGLDWQDVERPIVGAIPFMVGGGLAASVLKGLPLLGRLVLQAPVAASVSIGTDVVAGQMGSKQGIDLIKAGFAAGGAAVGEALSPAITALWRKKVTIPGMLNEDGTLSAAGRAEAERMGISAEQIAVMDKRTSERFAGAAARAADPDEIASQFKTGEFGLRSSKGSRTKDPEILLMEVEMRKGLWGDRAKGIMKDFDEGLVKDVDNAVTNIIGGKIAPNAPGIEKATLGKSVHDGIQTAKAYMDEAENQMWGRTGPLYPKPAAFDRMAESIGRYLESLEVAVPNTTDAPKAYAMLQALENFATGKDVFPKTPLLGPQWKIMSARDMQKQMLGLYKDAAPGSPDARTSRAIYDGFNKWIDDMAEQGMINGDVGSAAALKSARAFTKDMKQLFSPRDASGKLTSAGQRLDKILNKADSPETVLDAIVPQPGTRLKIGDIDVIKHMKEILTKNGAPEVWDDMRLAYWVKLAQDPKGKILSPQLLKNRIEAAFHNQRSALNEFYDADELSLIKRFADALGEATWVDPNPSGSSYALMRMLERFIHGGFAQKTAKLQAELQSKRELFSKHNILAARIWQLIGKNLPFSLLSSQEIAGARVAGQMTSDKLSKLRPPSFAGAGAAAGADLSE